MAPIGNGAPPVYTDGMTEPLAMTRAQARQFDAYAIETLRIPSLLLMENAGRAVAELLLQLEPSLAGGSAGRGGGGGAGEAASNLAVLCGKGNNAGDGFVAARQLAARGVGVTTLMLSPPAALANDARTNFDILASLGLGVVDLSAHAAGGAELRDALDRAAGQAAWLVDALLGTGATGAPREPLHTAIEWMNRRPARRLAIDIPSGLDCDRGAAAGAAVRADVTCTFAAAKPGLLSPAAAAFVGALPVAPLGLPPAAARPAIASSSASNDG